MSINHTTIISVNYTTAGFFLLELCRTFSSALQWRRYLVDQSKHCYFHISVK